MTTRLPCRRRALLDALVRRGLLVVMPLAALACQGPAQEAAPDRAVELKLVFLDEATGEPVPVRAELLDRHGAGHVARDALPVLCLEKAHRRTPPVEQKLEVCRRFPNPQTGTDQFYSSGRSTLSLTPGDYHLRVWKGLEYRRVETWLEVPAEGELRIDIRLERWVDMPRWEWFSSDDHLHLPRSTPESDAALLAWMAAEDIHVANLLQMGTQNRFDFAPQYTHDAAGRDRGGVYSLVSGQENPRTHFLGHMLILGTESPIHYPDEYLNLRKFFEEGRRQRALNGVGHFGRYASAQSGLGLVLPHNLVDFMEVMQFETGEYDLWYKVLNCGFRVAPTAGTDYPWAYGPPGRERFYAKVTNGFTVAKWKRAVRRGHTFVTNGPMLDFRVNGRRMGSALKIAGPGTVDVVARVLFDHMSDEVGELELIENGAVVRTFAAQNIGVSEIGARFSHQVGQSGWLAVRVRGRKRGELPVRQSLAHSAPIYISVEGEPPLEGSEEARRLARSWIVLLDDLEASLADGNVERLVDRPASAPVTLETIRQNRPMLLEEIRLARERFRELAD